MNKHVSRKTPVASKNRRRSNQPIDSLKRLSAKDRKIVSDVDYLMKNADEEIRTLLKEGIALMGTYLECREKLQAHTAKVYALWSRGVGSASDESHRSGPRSGGRSNLAATRHLIDFFTGAVAGMHLAGFDDERVRQALADLTEKGVREAAGYETRRA